MLKIKPIHIRAARDYVAQNHRHNIPPVGGKFAIACFDEERLCGVAICGRPTARRLDNGETLEIYRNCTDGTRNACSKLYGACIRIARDMGYREIITYTLESENGASLKAANFTFEGAAGGASMDGNAPPGLLRFAGRNEKSVEVSNRRGARMKQVLDVCCGGKMFYFDKSDPRVLFCDKRKIKTTLCDGREFEVSPDIQCDFTSLPFPDESFSLVVFDPPHLTRATGKGKYKEMYGSLTEIPTATGWQHIKYGELYDNWRDMIAGGFSECFRVLKQNGTLVFKWNETDIPVREVLKCTTEKPIFGHKSGKRSNTHWICFFKSENTKGVIQHDRQAETP